MTSESDGFCEQLFLAGSYCLMKRFSLCSDVVINAVGHLITIRASQWQKRALKVDYFEGTQSPAGILQPVSYVQ